MSDFKHHIFICLNQRPKGDPRGCCADNGSEQLHAYFKKEVERLGLRGIVRANKAGCLDHCEHGPSIVIYPEGVWYWVGSETDVREIMERHVVKGEIVNRLLIPGHEVPPATSVTRATPISS
ncbi:MAG: (2Fe-2S) ferredoxin domain-containing protein [Nitrospirales bacterium]|nr:(2Fe-2S) ferredoxin domain-containing protein [Nitrospirales bacterium]